MPFDCPDPPPVIPDPPPLVSTSPVARGPKRVEINGLWYDRYPDGTLEYCKECNRGQVPPRGATVSKEEHDALVKAGAVYVTVPEVTVNNPFRSIYSFDPDHTCNRCHAEQTIVAGWLPNGKHLHTCWQCGNIWYH